MNIQDILVYGITVLAVALIAIRIKRSFTQARHGGIRCADCPICEQCGSAKDKKNDLLSKSMPPKDCPQNKKSSKKSGCACK